MMMYVETIRGVRLSFECDDDVRLRRIAFFGVIGGLVGRGYKLMIEISIGCRRLAMSNNEIFLYYICIHNNNKT